MRLYKYLDEVFDQFVIIGSAKHRPDRLAHAHAQLEALDLPWPKLPSRPMDRYVHFEAHWKPDVGNGPSGNAGCTASHRGVMELIAHHGWERTLVLEDDFTIANPGNAFVPAQDTAALFAEAMKEVPDDWDLLYLGGHYAEKPKRISKHVFRTGRMLTTSSYGITLAQARKMAPHIYGEGPIDNLFWRFNLEDKSYCLEPRLFVQYANHSDLHDKYEDYRGAMLARKHVAFNLDEV